MKSKAGKEILVCVESWELLEIEPLDEGIIGRHGFVSSNIISSKKVI